MICDVKAFGACGDGETLDTVSVQKAIAACSAAGGGEVIFSDGTFLCGTLEILDGVTLVVAKGATLRASENLADFEKLPLPDCDVGVRIGFLYAIGKTDIGIRGEGTIDLSYRAWFTDERMPFEGMQNPLTEKQDAEATYAIHPRLTQPIAIHDCNRVVLRDIRIINSPSWTVSMVSCNDVFAHNVTIDNDLRVPNSDGIGFSVCHNVTVSDCRISCADDCLTFCGTRQAAVTNCVLRSRSSSVRIGYIENLTEDLVFENIVVYDSNRAFILQGSRHSVIRNILIRHLILHTRIIEGAWWGSGEPLTIIASQSGSVRRVSVCDVRAECSSGIALYGSDDNLSDIDLQGWHLTLLADNLRSTHTFIDLRDEPVYSLPVKKTEDGKTLYRVPWIFAKNVRGLKLRDIDVETEGDGMDTEPLYIGTTKTC